MLALIAAHIVAAVAAPALVRALDRRAFAVLAVIPAGAFVWALSQTNSVTGERGGAVEEHRTWIDSVGLDLSFRLSALSWLMTLVVTGVGALVLVFCAYYFRPGANGTKRFAGVLTAFAGAMLGLVLADDLILLYVFWELTTVLSYLLIGHNPERRANRRAAMQALIVTTAGGLAMLVGVVMLGQISGTYRISAILAAPPSGTAVTVAVMLLLAGAVSKSALVPFHFWLPGAMAAPTPVSAYLHAAAMVKAGVYLVALLAPAFADVTPWRPTLMSLGVATMILGGLRALRQNDLKLLLAYGTVSQLGFLMVLTGAGTQVAALAGLAMLLAHALFKAALFLLVGVIDRCTGTRDIRRLNGVWSRMPVAFAAAVLAAGSMAGLPPLAAFVAKETAYEAFVNGEAGMPAAASWATLAGLVIGSALTVAYSARFLWGGFARKDGMHAAGEPAGECKTPAVGFVAPSVLLALAGLAVGFAGAVETRLLRPYIELFPSHGHSSSLSLWHGFNLALGLSVLSLIIGLMLFHRRVAVERVQHRLAPRLDAEAGYRAMMRNLDRLAVSITGATQRGSLPVYIAVILIVVITVPGTALLAVNYSWSALHWWDTPAQAVVSAVIVIAAIGAARSRRRLKAVILTGVVGYGAALLFVLHGAPDLALTQILVETITLVIFVLVLRKLPTYFSDRPLTASRWWRMAVGVLVGLVMATLTFAAASSRTEAPVSEGYPGPAVSYGGGENVVNVALVDIRVWDTMGEISVLVVAATGVASLIFLITGRSGRWRTSLDTSQVPRFRTTDQPTRTRWLATSQVMAPDRRSLVVEVVTRLLFHTILIFSIYLLFTGHNNPGGGFAGGLVAGLALTVRYVAGGRRELNAAAPVDAGLVLGIGLFIATGSGLIPLMFGGEVLQSVLIDLDLPLIGHVHFVTSLFFDVGVYLVVIGLVLDMLRSLGGGIDSDYENDDASDAGRSDDADADDEPAGPRPAEPEPYLPGAGA
ncbi:Na+/H+ antiporter subunit A [Phytoactinopolyspora alkaliphila]|uniref:Na+/H+ antiporter subunit A n=1 Tax=Phytoactinopolyspora alkaliphila TaxID=1783498 RepID=A0A6N9YJ28_9ACTN|nr:Na+/H+ antiporter subunit A [Phytoactinopolyspora alkaliphila]